ARHIHNAPEETLAVHLLPFLSEKGIDAREDEYLYRVIATLKARSKTFVEMADGAEFYYIAPNFYDEKGAKKFLQPENIKTLEKLAAALREQDAFDEKSLEPVFQKIMAETGLGFGKIAQPLRLALVGKTVSPGIFEMIAVLGKAETISRIERCIAAMSGKTGISA
ncbi:MAG: glutamate--tRNA ligase, partial [Thermodesulfobacteriota bacterium]